MREQHSVAMAIGERRDLDDDLGDPVPQVLAERPFRDHVFRFLVRGAYNADVDDVKQIAVDVRILCATHTFENMIAKGAPRGRLWYRVAEVVIKIPPLAGDAVLLAHHFLRKYAREMKRPVKAFDADALAIENHMEVARGTSRKLKTRVKRAGGGRRRQPAGRSAISTSARWTTNLNLRSARERADRGAIRMALSRTESNVSNAAKLRDQQTDAVRPAKAIQY